MARPLGPNMIHMYVDMIQQDFLPIITRLKNRTLGIKSKVERQAKIDLGIYELYRERAALEVRMKEIRETLQQYENNSPEWKDASGSWRSRLQKEIDDRLQAINQPLEEVVATQEGLIRRIRLSGIGEDIKAIFDDMPAMLAELSGKFENLPDLTNGELVRLGFVSPEALEPEQV
jgi:DNA-binding transcriptional MerR regulator